jgi:bifunctional DNA-binding transcriptional regulator/antitoxin component of YhaV-PrlF toxin-antitoxin module
VTETVKEIKLETKLDSVGRVLFPAYLREAIGVGRGERVVIELREGKLNIYKPVTLEQCQKKN